MFFIKELIKIKYHEEFNKITDTFEKFYNVSKFNSKLIIINLVLVFLFLKEDFAIIFALLGLYLLLVAIVCNFVMESCNKKIEKLHVKIMLEIVSKIRSDLKDE